MLPVIEGFAAAVLETLSDADLATVVAGLNDLNETTETHQDLRGALTDTAVIGRVRAAVLRDVLGSKISPAAVRLAAYAAQVSPAQEVPHAFHDLVVLTGARQRDGVVPFEILSLSQSRQRVRGYAEARYENVTAADLDRTEDELFRAARIIESNDELRGILVDRDVTADARVDIVRNLFAGKISDLSLGLLVFAVVGGRPRDIVGTLDDLVDHAAECRHWRVARVWSAKELSSAEADEVRRSLAGIAGDQVEIRVSVKSDLLAGIIVEVGDVRLDATARGRLSALRDSLVSSSTGSTFGKND